MPIYVGSILVSSIKLGLANTSAFLNNSALLGPITNNQITFLGSPVTYQGTPVTFAGA